MTDEDLTGMAVMVHPELPEDPAEKQGEIGSITVGSLAEDLVRVRFDDDRRGLYRMDAVLVFKTSDQIYQHIEDNIMTMTPATFKDLKNIALLLDYGTAPQHLKAMKIAQKNPDAVSAALVSLEDSLGHQQSYKRGR
ncbi:hypothetical protein [Mucilaginibacter polytrichastri]|uniref:Uncharacterized protein n=1 Tax=Mucilaginibacter polytrichastri TaxID=1302689 RepID=A0A1Q6A2B7_9SPHI|nr:hypothetical protein [Mucilaginibacter polytrichastri]OKS88164.1 hypothetical protein RG47T_3628 [Mucilaginibacter polytrichastri]SFT09014.1 hypothetical protein SAMN04487890_11080 [Mucilaginibacter polytrichastri]